MKIILGMDAKMFDELEFYEQANYLWSNGEFIAQREYYNHKICLYTLKGFHVELHYSPVENEIDKIEAVYDEKVISHYLANIELNELFD